MDEHSIERIRNAKFSHSVRGYDRGEVDRFLADLAEWLSTGGDDAAAMEAVRIELERVGEQTAAILTEAHAAAQAIRDDAAGQVRHDLTDANLTVESLRTEADEYAADTRDEADTYSRKVRAEADSHADSARSQADAEVAEQREAAEREAERIVADANRRKADVEAVISDLEQRRDAVLAELERLASGIAGTATEYRPSPAADGDLNASADDSAGQADGPEPQDETAQTSVLASEPD